MSRLRPLLLVVLPQAAALYSPLAPTADSARGRQLAEANCMVCHDNSIYVRPDRKAKDFTALGQQIRQGEQALGLGWTDGDVADVAAWLDQQYYKLPR
jgi:cytochrome c5